MNYNANVPLPTYVRQFVENAKARMRPFIVVGELNRDYIMGNQNRKIDPNTTSIVDKQIPKSLYLERKIINRMLPIYLTRNGILSDNKPIPGFKPNPADPEASDYSMEGNKFIKEFMKEEDYDSSYKRMIEEADIFPLVFVKSGIDWAKGNKVFKQKITVKDKNDEDVKKTMNIYEGREFIDVVPIYEAFPDSVKVNSMEEINEFVHRRPFSLEHIRKRYPTANPQRESIDANYIPRGVQSITGSTVEFENHAYVYEYYRKADSEYPEGRFVIIINDDEIYDGKLPFENGGHGQRLIPFDVIRMQTVPGFLPGITTYSQLIDQQDTYNAIYNRFLEYVNRVGIGKKYAWKGSLLNEDYLNNKPGTVTMLSRFGKKPENDDITPIGAELTQYLKSLEENMLVTASLSLLTAYGQGGGQVRTDGVADKISASDSNKLGNAMKSISTGIIGIMRKVISMEQQRQSFLTEKEKLGLDKIDDYVVKYNIQGIDPAEVVIVNREFLMQSDQVIEKKMMQVTNMGVYNPEMHMSYRSKLHALDMIDANYLRETLDAKETANWSLIQSEHRNLFDEQEIEVKSYQDHKMHVEEHELLLMSSKLSKLKRTDAELHKLIVAALEDHVGKHQTYLQESQEQNSYDNAKAYM